MTLTLTEAIKSGRLGEFAAQEKKRGVGKANAKEFDALVGAAVKQPQSKGRTSRSPSRGGSRGK